MTDAGSGFLMKGAMASIPLKNFMSIPKFIIFQYNPESIKRTLTPKYSKPRGNNAQTFLIEDAPEEAIEIDIEFDDSSLDRAEPKHGEDLDKLNTAFNSMGVFPQLAALETMLYPQVLEVIFKTNAARKNTGSMMEVIPPATGFITLFYFGVSKVLPVKITQCIISEQEYENYMLFPVRAKVTLKMSVLTYNELWDGVYKIPYYLYMVNHAAKELAAIWAIGNNVINEVYR
jgi:hypothetical protein